jgi:hypothetical protein
MKRVIECVRLFEKHFQKKKIKKKATPQAGAGKKQGWPIPLKNNQSIGHSPWPCFLAGPAFLRGTFLVFGWLISFLTFK